MFVCLVFNFLLLKTFDAKQHINVIVFEWVVILFWSSCILQLIHHLITTAFNFSCWLCWHFIGDLKLRVTFFFIWDSKAQQLRSVPELSRLNTIQIQGDIVYKSHNNNSTEFNTFSDLSTWLKKVDYHILNTKAIYLFFCVCKKVCRPSFLWRVQSTI